MEEAERGRILRMLEEVSSSEDDVAVERDVPASDSEGEEDYLEEDEHVPDSDSYESDPDELSEEPQKKKAKSDGWKGKDGTTWWKKNAPKVLGRTRASNVIKFTPGPKGPALNADSPADFFGIFITPEIIDLLVEHTNLIIAEQKGKYAQSYRTNDTDVVEMKALIGLLMLSGMYHASRLHLADIWTADGTGIEVFRLTMSLHRFRFLLCCLRFDNKATREERKKVDKLAAFRQIFEMFVENCKKNYTPSEFVTIDEMLVAFRGRCSFRQYIPSKPAKYGIKIHALCDAKTFYVCNMEIYAGTQPDGPYKADKQYNSAKAVVTRLISDISGSARNVTIDNWYTSIPLVESLLRDHKLTTVGTLRKNKREIPPEFLVTKNRPLVDSMFGFGESLTLVSYVPKSKKQNKKKNVLLVSSMHHDDKIDQATGDDKKPEIITFYNSTKGGVDVVDMMVGNYNVSRNSRRWPLTLFFDLLNISCVNSYVLYAHNPKNKLKRRKFIKNLSLVLLEETQKRRVQNIHLQKGIRAGIARLLPEAAVATTSQSLQGQAKRCTFCARSKDRKVKTVCSTCGKHVCSDHSKMIVSCTKCENAATGGESD
jgi:hypothetical protein